MLNRRCTSAHACFFETHVRYPSGPRCAIVFCILCNNVSSMEKLGLERLQNPAIPHMLFLYLFVPHPPEWSTQCDVSRGALGFCLFWLNKLTFLCYWSEHFSTNIKQKILQEKYKDKTQRRPFDKIFAHSSQKSLRMLEGGGF